MNQTFFRVIVLLYYCRAGKFWIKSEFYPKLSGMSKNPVIGHQLADFRHSGWMGASFG
jgi:hypothetical protein